MLIPSEQSVHAVGYASLSRRVNANSQLYECSRIHIDKLIKKGEC